ncbi:DedA family protein [Streptomyces sp. NPDC057686]|uniref:DedA family protein n=1 Tax=Streptomyces sp. NPDC057686 TaxID=3346212 RepID=UPI0036A950E2
MRGPTCMAASVHAATHLAVNLPLPARLAASAVGALAGAQYGYLIGRRAGGALLTRSRSKRLHEGARRAEELPGKYGHAKAIVPAHFLPAVRTVLNPLAGALNVPARILTLWQVVGGLVWTVGLVLAGYAPGSSITDVDRYLLPVVAAIAAVSLFPLAIELLRSQRAGRHQNGTV